MKRSLIENTGWILLASIGLLTGFPCFAQTPPPNDNFANRILLTGSDVTFTGTLAGATLVGSHEQDAFSDASFYSAPTGSVWWTWTATTTTILYLEIIGDLRNVGDFNLDGIAVYQATNGAASVSNLVIPAAGFLILQRSMLAPTLSIPVVAGTDYQIQLIGSSSAQYTIRLVTTNAPAIVQQPRSQTVFSNASALFYVVSSGLTPQTYQWRFGTNDLSGETTPLLALTNIDSSLAGTYTVVVSNASGVSTSAPATLAVSQSKAPASLQSVGIRSDFFFFNLTGESGRSYRVESSTNLIDWTAQSSFPMLPGSVNGYPGASVVFYTNTPLPLSVRVNSTREYFRARPYAAASPAAEICINNLRIINIAKLLWQRDSNTSPIATPDDADLQPYFPHVVLPSCPIDASQTFDTSYMLGNLQIVPECKIDIFTHLLEEAP